MNVDACIEMLEYESGWEVAHAGRAEEVEGGIVVKDEDGKFWLETNQNIILGILDYWRYQQIEPQICPSCGETCYPDGAPDWFICNGCNRSFCTKER
jgi:hypothetical protein